mmetsp:Transcript_6991/g.22698  ORF Transcript_6991/g.22698 Transcript_6991/m.22698 type:complete len:129 (+) Transcript_6991:322-708(+)
MAPRYNLTTPTWHSFNTDNLDHLVDPTGVVAVAAARTGTHVAGRPDAHSSPSSTVAPARSLPTLFRSSRTRATEPGALQASLRTASVDAMALPRLPKGHKAKFRAAVRADIAAFAAGAPQNQPHFVVT